jgi:catechol 2,3-dioxygenase-like lactoylglutathione lyase family enzyme
MDIRIAVISLWAEDVPAAAHFYRDAIGLPLLPHHAGERPHFDLGGPILTILPGRPGQPPPEPRFPLLALSVPDLETALARLRLHGVALPPQVESNPAGRWVLFHDPAGNLIELVEWTGGRRDAAPTQSS